MFYSIKFWERKKMSRRTRFFDWCPQPQPPPHSSLRQFSKPLLAIAAATTILIAALLASSFFALTATVATPMAGQLGDDIQKALNTDPTSTPTASPAPTESTRHNSAASSGDQTTLQSTSTTTQASYNVSGYVKDANGNPISGAEVIFCVPDIIPAVFTDSSGFYQASAPVGTYHVYVWPPFNSSYMSFEQKELAVNSDVAKNVTLSSGYKLYGYITTVSGGKVSGAVVALGTYFNGYYSTVAGYYYVVAPAGTYTLTANPKTGVTFDAYNESNIVLNGDVYKNITIGNQPKYKLSGYVTDANGTGLGNAMVIFNVPDIVPAVYTNASGYYEAYMPAGTYHINVWPPFDSNYLSADVYQTIGGTLIRNFTLATGFKVSGYITDTNGTAVQGAIAILGNHISGWYSKASGYYFVTAPAGNYTFTVQPRTGASFVTYTLSNFAVNSDVAWNVTVTG
jgi:protocatechuate 3,4-dioxygenase beta subunit